MLMYSCIIGKKPASCPEGIKEFLRSRIPPRSGRSTDARIGSYANAFPPRGVSIHNFSDEQILFFDEINALPRKRLGYRTPEELFDDLLDLIYTVPRLF